VTGAEPLELLEDDPPSLADVSAVRALAYSVLARLLLGPEPQHTLAVSEALGGWSDAVALAPDLAAFGVWRELITRLEVPDAFSHAVDDYTELFVTGRHPGCDLAESSHVPPAANAEVLHAATQSLRRAGLAAHSASAPPDHAATQLELLAHSCHQESDAWQREDVAAAHACLDQEHKVLRERLLPWLPGVAGLVARLAPESLYASVLDAIIRSCRYDADYTAALAAALQASGDAT
jgi:TorA maturation chaperone TorD